MIFNADFLRGIFLRIKKVCSSHIILLVCAVIGVIGGIFGLLAGLACGAFVELVVNRIREEKKLRTAVADGVLSDGAEEPFLGAAYVCALGVYSQGDAETVAIQAKKIFGGQFPADWQTLCRAAGNPSEINGDFITECLASVILRKRKSAELPADEFPLKAIFGFLQTTELHWDKTMRGAKPSEYLARLLDYTVVSDEMAAAYKMLELETDASIDEVKSAHRRLAAQFHPDSADGDTERFQQIQAAYELLVNLHSFNSRA